MVNERRVVAIRVAASDDLRSGYALDGGQILTAAHGLGPVEQEVRVWFLWELPEADQKGAPIGEGRPARVSWLSPNRDEFDVALVQLPSGMDQGGDAAPIWSSAEHLLATGGRIECEAVGFPRFQRRGKKIDTEHFRGYLEPGSGQRRGELNALFRTGPRSNDDWKGMSGAALFADGCLVGIVRQVDTDRLLASPLASPLVPVLAALLGRLEPRPEIREGAPSLEQALLAAYHRSLESEHARPPGLFREHLAGLDTVFIELDVAAEGALPARHGGGRTLRELMAEPAPSSERAHRWVVLGHPGAGKSTLARHLVWELARAHASETGAALAGKLPIPVYASLPALASDGQHPFDRAERELRVSIGGANGDGLFNVLSERARQDGGVWLFLDGLDEVTEAQYHAVEARLLAWSRELPQVMIAVFSRIVGYRRLGEPYTSHAQLRPLSPEQQMNLLEKWLGRPGAQGVWAQIERSAALREACQVPLSLSLLAFLTREGGAAPRGRRDLFDRGIQALLERGHEEGSPGVRNPGFARQLLGELSLALQEVAGDAWPVEKLENQLLELPEGAAKRLKSWDDATHFLKDVGERSGVLAAHDGQGAPWRFFHRQFRELLAAETLRRRGRAPLLERAQQLSPEQVPRWAEVLGFACELSEQPLELLGELGKVSEALALRVLPEVEGVDPIQALGLLVPDGLWDGDFLLGLFARWREQGTFHPANIAGWLWSQVDGKRSVPELAALHYALVHLEGGVERERFFRRCARWPDGGPPEPKLVDIPAGEFSMGSPEAEEGRFDYEVGHLVRLSAFRLSPTAVTNAEYAAFDRGHEAETFEGKVPPGELGEQPVVNVSWWEAYLYSAWAGARLPTEAQWEYACRAGTKTAYSFGETFDSQRANTSETGRGRTVKVGSLPANAWGLYEMPGNVFEWCSDWDGDYPSQLEVNPTGPERHAFRLFRGGSWSDGARLARSASRRMYFPDGRSADLGFRLARGPRTAE